MQKYYNSIQAENGDAITTASIYVYLEDTTTPALIYEDDETTAISNPITQADAAYTNKGLFGFKAANNKYDIKIVNGIYTAWLTGITITDFAGVGIDDQADATAMNIDVRENIGIGVVPEINLGSSHTHLRAGGTGTLFCHTAKAVSSALYLGQNSYFDGTDSKYIVTDEASRLYQIDGTHVFDVSASGTADTAITWSTALTLDNSLNATFGGSVSIIDNKYLYVGTGNDMQLYHNATNSMIDSNTGNLFIREQVNSGTIELSSFNSVGTANNCLIAGGAVPKVTLFYNNAAVFETASTGVDIPGTFKLGIEKADEDDGFINFKATVNADATSAISSFTTSAAVTHHIQVKLNDVTAWIAVSTTDPTA